MRGVLDKKYRSRLMAYENLIIPQLVEKLREEYQPTDVIKDVEDYLDGVYADIKARNSSRVNLDDLGNYEEPPSPEVQRKGRRGHYDEPISPDMHKKARRSSRN